MFYSQLGSESLLIAVTSDLGQFSLSIWVSTFTFFLATLWYWMPPSTQLADMFIRAILSLPTIPIEPINS